MAIGLSSWPRDTHVLTTGHSRLGHRTLTSWPQDTHVLATGQPTSWPQDTHVLATGHSRLGHRTLKDHRPLVLRDHRPGTSRQPVRPGTGSPGFSFNIRFSDRSFPNIFPFAASHRFHPIVRIRASNQYDYLCSQYHFQFNAISCAECRCWVKRNILAYNFI